MYDSWFLVRTVTRAYHHLLSSYVILKLPGDDIGTLLMGMAVKRTYCSFLEMKLADHEIIRMGKHLAGDTFSCILDRSISSYEIIPYLCHENPPNLP